MKQQRILALLGAGFIGFAAFQNCAPQALPDTVSSGTGTSLSSSSVSTVALAATYLPNPVSLSGVAVITPTGGTSPYTYTLLSGAGKLVSNTYLAAAASETALILVLDSAGHQFKVSLVVGTAAATTGTTSGTPTPTPTATPTSLPTSDVNNVYVPGQGVMTRTCDLQGNAAAAQANSSVPALVYAEYCLVLMRNPAYGEMRDHADRIEDGKLDPDGLLSELAASPEFASKFQTSGMSATNYAVLMIDLLIHTTATTTSVTQLVGGTQGQNQLQVFNTVVQSSSFNSANPGMQQAEQSYLDETD